MNVHAMNRLLKRRYLLVNFSRSLIDILDFSSESNKENSPRNSKKSSDDTATDSNVSDVSVQRARGELRVLEQERSKLEKQRKLQMRDFETSKSDARRLLEVIREKTTTMNIYSCREFSSRKLRRK